MPNCAVDRKKVAALQAATKPPMNIHEVEGRIRMADYLEERDRFQAGFQSGPGRSHWLSDYDALERASNRLSQWFL